MSDYIGIDFGTTNSAIARAADSRSSSLVPLVTPRGTELSSWRSILFFEMGGPQPGLSCATGGDAIERYLDSGGDGRLIQSIKSHLASGSFRKTQIFNRPWKLEDLVGRFLRSLREASTAELPGRAVVGRPVRYWGAETAEDDDRAIERMRGALDIAGFDRVEFVFEPVAAAFHYAQRLAAEELVLVADFGGGTSDFTLIRVGPDTDPADPGAILANGGLGVGGDTFDGAIVDHVVSPLLGKGSSYTDEFGASMPVPPWLYGMLRRWHQLSFLKSGENMRLLEKVEQGSECPEQIEALIEIIEDDLGFDLHRAVEQAKIDLSAAPTANFRFSTARLAEEIAVANFDSWIEEPIDSIEAVIDGVLEASAVEAGAIDRVFATGGTSFVPRVRSALENRFGADRIVSGGELISVASGLAACAARLLR